MKETFISVDIETTGVIIGEDNISSIGACVVGNTKDNFYIELKPFTEKYNPDSIKIAGMSMQYLKEYGVDIFNALERFKEWVELHDNPVLVAFPVTFDLGFLNRYFVKYLKYNPFHSGIDIRSFAMAVLNIPFRYTTKTNLARKIHWFGKHTHNALDDSIEQANLFEKLCSINRGRKR